MANKDKKEEEVKDEDLDGPPTVLVCPVCDSLNITFVRSIHCYCLDCGHSW